MVELCSTNLKQNQLYLKFFKLYQLANVIMTLHLQFVLIFYFLIVSVSVIVNIYSEINHLLDTLILFSFKAIHY